MPSVSVNIPSVNFGKHSRSVIKPGVSVSSPSRSVIAPGVSAFAPNISVFTPSVSVSAPSVSVIMPAYNAERYISSSVESVLKQSFENFEFLIVNDGSTDGTEQILRDWEKQDRRIKLISRPNTGYVRALQEMVAKSTAPLIARMDADDLAAPDRLARQVRFMTDHPEVVLLGGAYELIDEHSRPLRKIVPPTDDSGLQKICLSGSTPICHPLAMFRRDAYLRAGGYDESFCPAEDLDLWLRLGEVGQVAALPDTLLQYRMHAASISEKKQDVQIANMRRACENAWARRGVSGSIANANGWRATGRDDSAVEQTLKYGWWAWNSGYRSTARAYGLSAIRANPLSPAGWKLLAVSLAKPLPQLQDSPAAVNP